MVCKLARVPNGSTCQKFLVKYRQFNHLKISHKNLFEQRLLIWPDCLEAHVDGVSFFVQAVV